MDEIIADLSNTKSVVAMFAILSLTRPRPQVQQDSGAPALSSDSSGAAGATLSTSRGAAAASFATSQTLGGFVFDTPERTGIRDAARASAIIGIPQMAEAHPQGFVGTLGPNSCTAWFTANSTV